jgi:hypothetical protein
MSSTFNLWLLIFLLQAIAILSAGYLGFFSELYLFDKTFLGFFTILVWFGLSFFLGRNAYDQKPPEDWHWFVSDLMMTLGLLGTVIGLAIVFKSFFGLNLQDISAAKSLIMTVSTGMSTALLTTIAGIVTATFAKIQLILLEKRFVA